MKDSYKAAVGIVARKAITTSHGPRFRSPAFVHSPARASVITKKSEDLGFMSHSKELVFYTVQFCSTARPLDRSLDGRKHGSGRVAFGISAPPLVFMEVFYSNTSRGCFLYETKV